jgi:hypothetical protein
MPYRSNNGYYKIHMCIIVDSFIQVIYNCCPVCKILSMNYLSFIYESSFFIKNKLPDV